MEARNPLGERAGDDGFAQFAHQHLVVVQVVDRVELRTENLADAVQMMQVGAREIAAGIARAGFVERARIVLVLRVLDLDVAEARKQVAVARVARRHHAVEHVDAGLHAVYQILGRADAHQIARLVLRQAWRRVRQDACHFVLRLADRQPADGESVEADVGQGGERFIAQILVHPPLHDAEQRVGVGEPVVLVARALRPAQGHAHRLGRFVVGRRVGRAFVEDHHNVGIERVLDAHRLFRRQEQLVAVDRRRELDAFLGDLAQRAEREDLEAAGVGEDRFVPAHEAVQAAVRGDDLQPRAQPQVEGVAEADLRTDLVEVARRHRLDRAVGADRHEDRRLDDAVRQRQPAAACGTVGGEEFKLHRSVFQGTWRRRS